VALPQRGLSRKLVCDIVFNTFDPDPVEVGVVKQGLSRGIVEAVNYLCSVYYKRTIVIDV
jgi:hypothetical protein